MNKLSKSSKLRKIFFNDEYGITEKVLNGTITVIVRLKKKNNPPFHMSKMYAIAQCYNDLPEDARPDVSVKQWGYNLKNYASADFLPHHIKIISVKSIRLHDITDDDILKAGVFKVHKGYVNGNPYKIYPNPRSAFRWLIGKLENKFIWRLNPWVWVYEFVLVD